MSETLLQAFQGFYSDYRTISEANDSYNDAFESLAYYVITQVGILAEDGKLDEIRYMVQEFLDLKLTQFGSNDSLQEQFEDVFVSKVITQ
jgi:uncharacterized protein YllA (UPF0747 family)